MVWRATVVLLGACLVCAACVSTEEYARQRREGMLAAYPPGVTTAADVRARWAVAPDVVARRESGWAEGDASRRWVAERALASERRTGKRVARVERYSGPDGLFGLCRGWFFYDDADRVVDVEWQYMSD